MIILRPAQELAIPAARKALREEGRALVVLASALGKMIASALIWRSFRRGPGLFLAHTNGILDHAVQEYSKIYGPRTKMALYNGQSKDIEGAQIIFATFQTMVQHLQDFPQDHFRWMTVDESHHAQARTWRRVIEYFTCPRLGITATPDREDMLDIRQLFGPEVVNITFEEAIAHGWLPRIEYHLLTDHGFDEEALAQLTKDVVEDGQRLTLKEVNRRLFVRTRDEEIARIIEEYDEKTIVFCSTIEHADRFSGFLESADTYHSHQTDGRNRAVMADLRSGLTRRILAVDAFNEGIDVPEVGLLVFNRSTKSERIFRQQLGRGLRPVKDTLVVLDFVGNVERVIFLKKMSDRIVELRDQFLPPHDPEPGPQRPDSLHVSGAGFDFTFSDTVIPLMEIVRRISAQFYPTWQEASTGAIELGFASSGDYAGGYKQDPRLPASPSQFYDNFPDWDVFLDRSSRERYGTWQEAAAATRQLGIVTWDEYLRRYKEDSRLYSNPSQAYSDFPRQSVFLGITGLYPTWQEAAAAAKKLGARTREQYLQARKHDSRLPSSPVQTYADVPDWSTFFGKARVRKGASRYTTWQQASRAAQRMNLRSQREYKSKYIQDPKLPSEPERSYPDFPGYGVFLAQGTRRPT